MNKLFPDTIEFQSYSVCNADCLYCPEGRLSRLRKDKPSPMPWEVFEAMLEQTRAHPVRAIRPHLDCEPLLHKELPRMIQRCKEVHPQAEVSFSTNGLLLTKDTLMDLVNSGLDKLYVHFMGISKEFHERIMQTNYERVRGNIISALTVLSELGFPVELKIEAHRIRGVSLSKWYDFVKEWEKRGAIVTIEPLWNRAGHCSNFDNLALGLRSKKHFPCRRPFSHIAILYDGTVIICSLDHRRQIILGNLMDHTIEEIWNSAKLKEIRVWHNSGRFEGIHLCNSCIRTKNYFLSAPRLRKFVFRYNLPGKGIFRALFDLYLRAIDLL